MTNGGDDTYEGNPGGMTIQTLERVLADYCANHRREHDELARTLEVTAKLESLLVAKELGIRVDEHREYAVHKTDCQRLMASLTDDVRRLREGYAEIKTTVRVGGIGLGALMVVIQLIVQFWPHVGVP